MTDPILYRSVDQRFPRKLGWFGRYLVGRALGEDLSNLQLGNTEGAEQAMSTLEATLRAELWFFERAFEKLGEQQPIEDYQLLPSGKDHLLHFAQFLFFLRALDCTSAERVGEFIDNHNQMVEAELAAGSGKKKPGELKKALFGPMRKKKVTESIRALNRPVFAIYEYGHLLMEHMSPKTTENLIEDLRLGKLLVEVKDNSIKADPRRVLYASTGFLEEIYERSLLVQRRLIADTIDMEELARIKST